MFEIVDVEVSEAVTNGYDVIGSEANWEVC
jgi:hypothetical protein